MLAKEISSLQHPIVKHFIKLRKDSSYRDEHGSVYIVGSKLISELAPLGQCKSIICGQDAILPPSISCKQIFFAPQEVLQKISGRETKSLMVAELQKPKFASLSEKKFVLVLDRVSDPGNLGTLLRSALAFGWEGVYISEESCDPFNEKAVQAAKGATFKIPLMVGPIEKFMDSKRKFYVADAKGPSFEGLPFEGPIALILGNEASGPSIIAKMHSHPISIPMSRSVESLNVAAAGAILLYMLKDPHAL